jgi:tetratricopeptide (TPR) repeat protein
VPRWLNEGLAEYFSDFDTAYGKARLGLMAAWRDRMRITTDRVLGVDELPSVSRLMTLEAKDFSSVAPNSRFNYQGACALIHYLANGEIGYEERFRAFVSAVAAGRPAPVALTEQYGPVETIEPHYRAWLRKLTSPTAKTSMLTVPFHPLKREIAVARRSLDDGEVHLLWAWLQPRRATSHLRRAEKHAPDSAAVHRWHGLLALRQRNYDLASREFARAIEVAPGDPFYRFLALQLRFDQEELKPKSEQRLEALADDMRKLELFAVEPQQLNFIAWYYTLTGDADRGLPLALRATTAEPECAVCLDTLALLYFTKGKLQKAWETQQAAIERWPEGVRIPSEIMERLERYRKAVAPPEETAAGK